MRYLCDICYRFTNYKKDAYLTRLQVVIVIISVHILFDFPAIFQIHAVTIMPGKGNESELFIQPGGMANIYFSV